MTLINRNTLETNSYDTVFNEINNASNVADPRDPTGNRKFVYDLDPLDTGFGFDMLPYVIVGQPVIEYAEETVDGRFKNVAFVHEITVRTARDGSTTRLIDSGRTDLSNISDDLQKTFNSVTVRKRLINENFKLINLQKSSTDLVVIDQKQLYENVYELRYQTHMQVSD